jgi:hypothetical protein
MRPVTLAAGKTLADFTALLVSRQFNFAEAVAFKLAQPPFAGTVLAWTTAQRDFTVPPCDGSLALQTYVAGDVLMSGFKFSISGGQDAKSGEPSASITVDEQSITLIPNANPAAPSMIGAAPLLQAAGQAWKALDAATFQRDRWYFDDAWNPVGGVPIFYGYAASIDSLSRTQVQLKVKSDLVLLDIQMPRNLYQPNCQYTVYSGPCGAVKASYASHASVGASSAPTATFIPWTGSTAQFAQGEVTFESGANTNLTRTIRKADTTGLWLAYPLPFAPAVGDLFVAYPGCDRQYGGGCAYFGRQSAYRATPFVPNAEMAV